MHGRHSGTPKSYLPHSDDHEYMFSEGLCRRNGLLRFLPPSLLPASTKNIHTPAMMSPEALASEWWTGLEEVVKSWGERKARTQGRPPQTGGAYAAPSTTKTRHCGDTFLGSEWLLSSGSSGVSLSEHPLLVVRTGHPATPEHGQIREGRG